MHHAGSRSLFGSRVKHVPVIQLGLKAKRRWCHQGRASRISWVKSAIQASKNWDGGSGDSACDLLFPP